MQGWPTIGWIFRDRWRPLYDAVEKIYKAERNTCQFRQLISELPYFYCL